MGRGTVRKMLEGRPAAAVARRGWAVLLVAAAAVAAAVLLSGCGSGDEGSGTTTTEETFDMSIIVQSDAFDDDGALPQRFTADGDDVSPPLRWSNAPMETGGFAIICDDPDAPGDEPYVHWVLYALSPDVTSLPEDIEAGERPPFPEGAEQGRNSGGVIGYSGPAPPKGSGVHHYHFTVYALDRLFDDLEPGLGKTGLLDAIDGHVLAQGEIVGTYERK